MAKKHRLRMRDWRAEQGLRSGEIVGARRPREISFRVLPTSAEKLLVDFIVDGEVLESRLMTCEHFVDVVCLFECRLSREFGFPVKFSDPVFFIRGACLWQSGRRG